MRVGILMPPKSKIDFGTKVCFKLIRSGMMSLGIQHDFINLDYVRVEYGDAKQSKTFYQHRPISHFNFMISLLNNPEEANSYILLKHLEESNIPVVNSVYSSIHTRFKPLMLQKLNSDGISIPKTVIIRTDSDLDNALAVLGGFPVILKTPCGSRGAGVSICESKRSLQSVIQTLIPQVQPLILQEFVSESSGTDFKILATHEQVICSFKRQASTSTEFRANVALGGIATPITIEAEMALLAKRVIKSLGLVVGSVDILRSRRGYLVIDVNDLPEFNLSFNQLEFIEKDFASFFISHLLSLVSKHLGDPPPNITKNPRANFSLRYYQSLLPHQIITIDPSKDIGA